MALQHVDSVGGFFQRGGQTLLFLLGVLQPTLQLLSFARGEIEFCLDGLQTVDMFLERMRLDFSTTARRIDKKTHL